MPRPDVQLLVDGRPYDRWTSFQLVRGVEEMAWTYELEFADEWTPQSRPFPFEEGQEAQILIGGQPVLDGYLEDVAPRYDSRTHGITITGRSRSGQLVDCAALHKSGRWKDQPLLRIANDIVMPFGMDAAFDPEVVSDPKVTQPFTRFALQSGETCFDALDRLARMRGLLIFSSATRSIVFSRATSTNVLPRTIRRGEPLNAARLGRWSERFSRYIVKGQSRGTDTWFGDEAARGFADAVDPGVTVYRPIVILAEGQGGRTDLERRAVWQRNVSAGRSRRVTYTMQDWHSGPGQLWRPNQLVQVEDDWLGISGQFLISRVTLMYGSNGARAGLELVDRAAFDVFEPPKRKRAAA